MSDYLHFFINPIDSSLARVLEISTSFKERYLCDKCLISLSMEFGVLKKDSMTEDVLFKVITWPDL